MFRLGLVGGGRMGRAHIRALESSSSVAIVAVTEPSPTSAALLPNELAVFGTVSDMLQAAELDGALIAVPSGLHGDVIAQLVAGGLPVLCEKPCGVAAEQTRQAAALVADAGIAFQVGYWRRFVPSLQVIKRRIQAGEFGDLFLVSSWQWDQEPPAPEFRLTSGGICIDMGVHEFDQTRWLTGQEFESFDLLIPGPEYSAHVPGDPESLQIQARMSGGTIATVSLGRRYPPGDMCKAEVYGTGAAVETMFLAPMDGEVGFLAAIREQAESFARYAQGGPREGASIDDAIAALEVAERVSVQLSASMQARK
jgi:myo-inositol 2-dehydrogenase / D-chiro-inositol 1-dehydrogenase